MAISFRWGAMNEDNYQYAYASSSGSGTVYVGTIHSNYHNFSIAVEISGLAKQDYHIGFTVAGSSGGGYGYPRDIKASNIVDGKCVIQGGLSLQADVGAEVYVGCTIRHYVSVFCYVEDANGNELGRMDRSFYIEATLGPAQSVPAPDPEPDPEPEPIIPEPEPEPIKPIKILDLGKRYKPFGVRYAVSDPDLDQSLTVTEKLNDKIIRVVNDFDRNSHGTVKITKELFTPLERYATNTIEVTVSDGMGKDSYYMTFTKENVPPVITCYSNTDLGTVESMPTVTYSVDDENKDTVTVTEKINGVQIKSFECVLNQRYTINLPQDTWLSCSTEKNTIEIIATDTYGATDSKTITFAKAEQRTTYTVFYAIEGDLRYERVFISIDGVEEARGYTFTSSTYDTYMDYDISKLADNTEIKIWMVAHDGYASSKYKSSNVLTFRKLPYGKPQPVVTLSQDHSEYGHMSITYNHEDIEYVNGQPVSKDPIRDISDYRGEITIHCYVDGRYTCSYPLTDRIIQAGDTVDYTINFNEISPVSRSHTIKYYVTITDVVTGTVSSDVKPENCNETLFVEGSHYYNDEPDDPIVKTDYKEEFGIQEIDYGFDSVNLYWDSLVDADGDNSIYYVYINTPESLNETVHYTSLPSRRGPNTIPYTRRYRVTERYNENREVIGCTVEYHNGTDYVNLQTNDFLGIHIDYLRDQFNKRWPQNEEYTVYVQARDTRPWENSYYGLNEGSCKFYRKKHACPNNVELTIIPNLVDGLGDGEKGRMTVLYTHPEIKEEPGIVDIYAYQDNELKCKVYSGEFYDGIEQTLTIDFTMYEYNINDSLLRDNLNRSKSIRYYAIATDSLGFTSFDDYKEIGLDHIPYLEPLGDGTYNTYVINVDGVMYDYNVNGQYKGPVQKGSHYFNEEPPATTPEEVDPNIIGYQSAAIKWPHVKDPDGDEVKYEIYVANSISAFNSEEKEFFNDNQVDDNDYVEGGSNSRALVSTFLRYHKVIEIPASVAEEYSQKFEISLKEYVEDSSVNVWIVSKDPYVNSYYRAGEVINIPKGHEGKAINIAYPRNGSTVYAKQPRILIYLGEDNLEQTTYVQWKEHTYNNRDNPELFSNPPNIKNVTVFKPPEVYTGISGTKVTFSVWVHNKCTYGPKKYITYTYRNFFDSFSEDKLIPIKSSHVNAFRQAIDITRDAYGLDVMDYTRKIEKNMIFENFDFNETKKAIMDVNEKINNADSSDQLDYNNPLIVDVNDLDLVEYEGSISAGSYEEFVEWARLLYILENL